MNPEPMPRHLLVVAGGTGERLGRVDKALCVVGGVRLIDRALSLPVRGRRLVIRPVERASVGEAPDGRPVEVVSEEPAGGGPAAGLAAGVAALFSPSHLDGPDGSGGDAQLLAGSELVAVLAADHLDPVDAVVSRLTDELTRHPDRGIAVAAPGGEAQWLTAVWRIGALTDALAALGDPRDAAVRRLVALGDPVMVDVPRIPSLDRLEDLVGARDAAGLGISGPEPQLTRLCSRLLETGGWHKDDQGWMASDPEGHPAVRLVRRPRVAPESGPGRPDPVRWVTVAPAGSPAPPWAVASLVALD